jgi:hypothetical protein
MFNVLPAPLRLIAIGVMAGAKLADVIFEE